MITIVRCPVECHYGQCTKAKGHKDWHATNNGNDLVSWKGDK